jgi:hypothetical protein
MKLTLVAIVSLATGCSLLTVTVPPDRPKEYPRCTTVPFAAVVDATLALFAIGAAAEIESRASPGCLACLPSTAGAIPLIASAAATGGSGLFGWHHTSRCASEQHEWRSRHADDLHIGEEGHACRAANDPAGSCADGLACVAGMCVVRACEPVAGVPNGYACDPGMTCNDDLRCVTP